MKLEPLMISMGGSSEWTARAMTDLAVPREPEPAAAEGWGIDEVLDSAEAAITEIGEAVEYALGGPSAVQVLGSGGRQP